MTKITLLLILLFTGSDLFCQYNGHNFSVSLNGLYTTSGSIFLNPNSNDIVLRNETFDIDDILDYGIEVRYGLGESFIIGLNVEYIKQTAKGPNFSAPIENTFATIIVEDGFLLIPLEVSAYYLLPFSTEDFKFSMGGGLAYYNGEFIRKIGDAEITNVDKQAAFGIHVSVGMDYMLRNNVAINFSMKFRDPQLTVKSKYSKQDTMYEGHIVPLPEKPFDTKIDINGVTFVLGIAFQI